MNTFTLKRLARVVLGIVLPLAVVVVVLLTAMRRAYLEGADALGLKYGQNMAAQAAQVVKMVTQENQNNVYLAAAALPDDFASLPALTRVAHLDALAEPLGGRNGTFFYYSQDGVAYASDGTAIQMHYTSRPDISAVLAGSAEYTMYGPLFEDGAESDTAALGSGSGERSGYVVYFTVPVRNEDGAIVAAFSMRRDAYLYSDALAGLSLGEGGYTCLLNAEGTVIAASSGPYTALVAAEEKLTELQGAYGEAAAAALAGGSGTAESVDETVGDAVVAYSALYPAAAAADTADGISLSGAAADTELQADAGWAVLTYLPKSELEGYLAQQAGRDLWGGVGVPLALVCLAALTVFYVAFDALRARRGERVRKSREHRDVMDQTLRAMTAALDARDVPDKGHAYRVAAYAREIGKHLELTPEEEETLYFEAALHDIGQIAVPEEILRHEADPAVKLTEAEGRRLREHVTVGGRILGRLTALPGINLGAMYHHQHYDGGGYCSDDVPPVKGADIPMPARIIAVANAYDLQRIHGRTGLDEMLENGKGTRYDPIVADIMVQLIHDGTIDRLTREAEEDALRADGTELATV